MKSSVALIASDRSAARHRPPFSLRSLLFRPSHGPRTRSPRPRSEPYISQDSCPVMINNVSRKRKSFRTERGMNESKRSRQPKRAPRIHAPANFRSVGTKRELKFRSCHSTFALHLLPFEDSPLSSILAAIIFPLLHLSLLPFSYLRLSVLSALDIYSFHERCAYLFPDNMKNIPNSFVAA